MVEEKGLNYVEQTWFPAIPPLTPLPPPVNLNRVTQDGRVKSTLMRGIDL